MHTAGRRMRIKLTAKENRWRFLRNLFELASRACSNKKSNNNEGGSRRYDAILFDLDGTLLDTLGDLHAAVNYALEAYGQPKRSLEEVRDFVGNGVSKLMERAIPGGRECVTFSEELEAFSEYYLSHIAVFTKPYDGIYEMLDTITAAGIRAAVVSNKLQSGVDEIRAMYLSDWIDTALGDDPKLHPTKPSPHIVAMALQRLFSDTAAAVEKQMDISPEEIGQLDEKKIKRYIGEIVKYHPTLYVGDSLTDAATAENSGLDYILCSWGFRPREELLGANALIVADHPSYIISNLNI